jgi:phage tail sheath protein FI
MMFVMPAPIIDGVSTSVTAFVGIAEDGPLNVATSIASFVEYQTIFGGLAVGSDLSYAVYQFFLNGGSACYVVRSLVVTAQTFADAATALGSVPIFNLLCVPGVHDRAVLSAANLYAASRRAFLILDVDPNANAAELLHAAGCSRKLPRPESAAIYAPWLEIPNPLNAGVPLSVAPSGTIAGVYASSDAARGVWSAPAGASVQVLNVDSTAFPISDAQSDDLNFHGINAIRKFPNVGIVPWGARTMAGQDSQWAYIPVRRLLLYVEQRLLQGTQWVVFETSNPMLWATVRQSIEAFLEQLFKEGALAGQTPDQAYFVKCDATTMTQVEIQNGQLNVVVGVAPVYPTEFVVFQIQQFTA